MEVYMAIFNKYLLGDSQIATTLEVDGENHILRAALGDMLRWGEAPPSCSEGRIV